MEFLILAYDAKDPDALKRRMDARQAHIETIDKYRSQGNLLYGAAILDDTEKMIGSVIIGSFENRKELDNWLKVEPYVTAKVWEKIEIQPCKTGPSFLKNK